MSLNTQTYKLPEKLASAVAAALDDWKKNDKVKRMWNGDATVWTGADEGKWLGWLTITGEQLAHIEALKNIATDIAKSGYKHAVLLGMGGSSLCPEVMRMTFGKIPGHPEMHVLDSTDPAQIAALQAKLDLNSTLCIVSSKSGGTLEPNIFKQYFFAQVKAKVGAAEVGNRFIAVTDPGSKMQRVAEADKFRKIFMGVPSIGGRYSALSNFGMVPAAVLGVNVVKFLNSTEEMVKACGASVAAGNNPGVILGAILGAAANQGRDKVTIVASPGIHDLGAWLEQLLAESTGKIGKGIIPVDREDLGNPNVYGSDRVIAYLRLDPAPDAAQDAAIDALEKSGQPVVRIGLPDIYNLGQEFFRWEIATATAGAIIGIDAFNQPDVEASKIETKKLTSEYEEKGHLPPETPFFEADGMKLYADDKNAAALKGGSLVEVLKKHLDRIHANDYFGVLGYVPMNDANDKTMQSLRMAVRDKKKVATVLGFGPRFLHSTGQAYKGGPNSGVFLQVTCDDAQDLPVPGQQYTFGIVKAAQARGDFQVLADRNRRALRVHLGSDVKAGITKLSGLIKEIL